MFHSISYLVILSHILVSLFAWVNYPQNFPFLFLFIHFPPKRNCWLALFYLLVLLLPPSSPFYFLTLSRLSKSFSCPQFCLHLRFVCVFVQSLYSSSVAFWYSSVGFLILLIDFITNIWPIVYLPNFSMEFSFILPTRGFWLFALFSHIFYHLFLHIFPLLISSFLSIFSLCSWDFLYSFHHPTLSFINWLVKWPGYNFILYL